MLRKSIDPLLVLIHLFTLARSQHVYNHLYLSGQFHSYLLLWRWVLLLLAFQKKVINFVVLFLSVSLSHYLT
jgi:hypothetical protein